LTMRLRNLRKNLALKKERMGKKQRQKCTRISTMMAWV
jgi:hypothetical protein